VQARRASAILAGVGLCLVGMSGCFPPRPPNVIVHQPCSINVTDVGPNPNLIRDVTVTADPGAQVQLFVNTQPFATMTVPPGQLSVTFRVTQSFPVDPVFRAQTNFLSCAFGSPACVLTLVTFPIFAGSNNLVYLGSNQGLSAATLVVDGLTLAQGTTDSIGQITLNPGFPGPPRNTTLVGMSGPAQCQESITIN
jgi:hypothetical protein